MDFTPFWVVHWQRQTIVRKKGIFQVIWGLFLHFRNVNFQPCESKGDGSHLEAVENSNVDLHQCLVLPQGRRLPGIQGHFVSNLLHQTPGSALSAPSLLWGIWSIWKNSCKCDSLHNHTLSRTEDMHSLGQSEPVRTSQGGSGPIWTSRNQSEPLRTRLVQVSLLPLGCCSVTCHRSPWRQSRCPCTSRWRGSR